VDFNECVGRGMAFFQEEKFGPALENFEAALQLQPGNADICQLVEMLKQMTSMTSDAARVSADEARHRAEVLGIDIADVDNVIAGWTEELKSNPNDTSIRNNLAYAYYARGLTFTSKGEHARAIEDYNEAIKNNPDYPLAFNKRGQANIETRNYDQAIKDFEKVVQFNPDDAQPKKNLSNAYKDRGIAYDQKKDYARAIPDFEMVLKFNPDDNITRELLEMAKASMA
jgi:tetratricopeptide (TPR) repeat protein